MEFSEKEVKRSVRNFESAVQDIVQAGYKTYRSRIKTLMGLCKDDPVINSIVTPFFSMPIELERIHVKDFDWIILNLPSNLDEQIAYVLTVFKQVAESELSLEDLSFEIFQEHNVQANIQRYISQVAFPCLRELNHRLNDLIEDQVDGKKEIPRADLNIINYGTLNAERGANIAIGKDIHQSIQNKSIKEEILKKVRESNLVPEESIDVVEEVATELEQELSQSKPSESKLKELARKVYDIGEQGILKIFRNAVDDPRWGQALLDMILQ
ncbi:hypothetical protein ETZ92_019320 [Bacillus velezensis]|uniref:hypothetical protein n=1 Tax=Bacillus velezensis TaxID=492670 RepID=UPI000B4C4E96|nr:hypothetical protein [Bacillus velezensis]OWP58528.1 hypothetical protein CEA92_14470 [Bacillus velezensis]QEQ06310.1 hypothetical protein ETZ92_019320 [Bacillus velezensis]